MFFQTVMPLIPQLSHKKGVRHAVFTSRFDRYVGEWKNDLKDGKGAFLTITGKLYEGDWYKGFRHGFGNLSVRQENGTFKLVYRGSWVRGKPEGFGQWWYDNGDVYNGFWKKGKHQGFGRMWYANGSYYVGYWDDGKRSGLGMLVTKNGDRYEGNWEDDKKNGLGRFYHIHTGQLQEGCWVDDVCVKSKMADIILRQFCETPTTYPIPFVELKDPRMILEDSDLWRSLKLGELDRHVKKCIEQI